jgi:DNA-directed RNA polymerase subunit N (RpoN/RPB10)
LYKKIFYWVWVYFYFFCFGSGLVLSWYTNKFNYSSLINEDYFIRSKIEEFFKEEHIGYKSLTKEEISKLLLSLGVKRYCCKIRMMTYKDIVQDILPIQNNE